MTNNYDLRIYKYYQFHLKGYTYNCACFIQNTLLCVIHIYACQTLQVELIEALEDYVSRILQWSHNMLNINTFKTSFWKTINILLKLTLAFYCLGVVTPLLQLALGSTGVEFHFRCCREKIYIIQSSKKKICRTNGFLTFSMFSMECLIWYSFM